MSDADAPSGRGGRGRGHRRRRGRNEQGQEKQQTDYWQRTPREFREWAGHLVTKKEYNELSLQERSGLFRDFTLAQKSPAPPPSSEGLTHMLQRFLISHADPYVAISEAHYSRQDSVSVRNASIAYYGLSDEKFCQVLGPVDPNRVSVINAHIWPLHACQDLSLFDLDQSCVHDPQNVLRLQKDIERAFDSRQLTFIEDTTSSPRPLVAKVLCPASVSDTVALTGTNMSLSDIDGHELRSPSGQTPFKRILAHHSVVSHRYARARGWLRDDELSQAEIQASALLGHSLDEQAQARLKLLWKTNKYRNENFGDVDTPLGRFGSKSKLHNCTYGK